MDKLAGPIPREALPEDSRWDLSDLFSDDADWDKDFKELEKQTEEYSRFQGTLDQSVDTIRACLEFDMNLSRKLEALHTYAHLKNDEDKTNSLYHGNFDRVTRLAKQVSMARSFINSELMAVPKETMKAFLEKPELEFFKRHLERILRYQKHTLSEKEESLLASSLEMSCASRESFGMLNNADLNFGTIQDGDGNEIAVTHGSFQSLMQNYKRQVRMDAFEALYGKYQELQHTFATLLSNSIKKDLFYAQSRHYPSVREQALFAENINSVVYDNLVATVHDNLEPLFRYFTIRKKVLGLEELHVYDCSVPIVKNIQWHMEYPEAVEKIQEALQPLGQEYVETLRLGLLKERWVDRYENRGKQSGAYSSGCYDSRPYILMNYRKDDINSIYTLSHEAGHSMHSYYSRKTQPYLYSDYTIFVAEAASTFNEVLLTRYFLAQDIPQDIRIYLICREIDNFRGTLYRQTMFAEFEHQVYSLGEKGEPLTVDAFKKVYKTLLERYFGSGVVLDDPLLLECFRIPHFYFSFYVYKYATGISAAYSLAERVLEGGITELEDYLRFLKAGGTQFPLELLKDAGVDMTMPQPIQKALRGFSSLVDQLETLTQ